MVRPAAGCGLFAEVRTRGGDHSPLLARSAASEWRQGQVSAAAITCTSAFPPRLGPPSGHQSSTACGPPASHAHPSWFGLLQAAVAAAGPAGSWPAAPHPTTATEVF